MQEQEWAGCSSTKHDLRPTGLWSHGLNFLHLAVGFQAVIPALSPVLLPSKSALPKSNKTYHHRRGETVYIHMYIHTGIYIVMLSTVRWKYLVSTWPRAKKEGKKAKKIYCDQSYNAWAVHRSWEKGATTRTCIPSVKPQSPGVPTNQGHDNKVTSTTGKQVIWLN